MGRQGIRRKERGEGGREKGRGGGQAYSKKDKNHEKIECK